MRTHGTTTSTSDDGFRRLEVITGVGRRRRWTDEEKAWIVAESLDPRTSAGPTSSRPSTSSPLPWSASGSEGKRYPGRPHKEGRPSRGGPRDTSVSKGPANARPRWSSISAAVFSSAPGSRSAAMLARIWYGPLAAEAAAVCNQHIDAHGPSRRPMLPSLQSDTCRLLDEVQEPPPWVGYFLRILLLPFGRCEVTLCTT